MTKRPQQQNITGTKPHEFEEIESPDFVKFEKIGDSLEGTLILKGQSDNYGFGVYDIKTPKEETVSCHGSVDLDSKMKNISVGDYIRITLSETAESKKGYSPMKIFKVERSKA